MKIVLTTCGSRGDVQPMLALSLKLKQRGHNVLLVGPPEKALWAKQLGCPYHPLGSNVTAFIDSMKSAHTIFSGIQFLTFLKNEIINQFEVLPELIAGADLVIGSSLVFALSSVAQSMGIDYRYIAFTPQLLPSSHHPCPFFKHQNFPRWHNNITWRFTAFMDKFNFTHLINTKRKDLSLHPIPDILEHVLGQKVIVASDSVISKVPQDVAVSFSQVGYMHLSQPVESSSELNAFLEAGPPPVYAGFGSMPMHDQIANVAKIVRAVKMSGTRVVIAKFWEGPTDFSDDKDVFFIQKYPHLQLFPRMAAVIHHGGAGTTASAAISGVPQIIVPHILDQYYWGNQIYQSHLGPKPIWRSKLLPKKLAKAIEVCISDKHIQQRAKTIGKKIQQQDSMEIALREIMNQSTT